jgi:hypothetical protein
MSFGEAVVVITFIDFSWRYAWLSESISIPLGVAGQLSHVYLLARVFFGIREHPKIAPEEKGAPFKGIKTN